MHYFSAFRLCLTCVLVHVREDDVGCHRCSVSLRLDGV